MSMKKTRGLAALGFALALTVAAGMLHGSQSRRWGASPEEQKLGRRLDALPEEFAGWTLNQKYEISDAAKRLLQPTSYVNRSYIGPNGEQVGAAVILGAHGPISVHTPEICYSSRDYKQLGPREAVTITDSAGKKSQFWKLTFQSQSVDQSGLRVYYAWSPTADWKAVESPRFDYYGEPYLFKIQVACPVSLETDDPDDAARRFLQAFVPAVKRQLFGNP